MGRIRDKRAVAIKEIADNVGLSKTTVSYVLSGKYRSVNISEETADRVLKVAREMGYRSNFWARSLVHKRSKLIGVLYPDLTGSAAHQITQGIQDVLGRDGYEAILAVSFWDSEKERREIELMLEKRVEGIIALPQPGSEEAYQSSIQSNCPVVFVGDYLPKIPASSVTLDPKDTVYKLLNHLHQLGHRRIYLLTVDYPSATLLEREEAFKVHLRELGLEFKKEYIYRAKLATESSVYERTREIIRSANKPDALVCISDTIALQALGELARLNVSVPEDLAVVGIGNLELTDHPFFALTTVDECRRELGRQSARFILERIEMSQFSEAGPKHIRIKGPLIVRRSTVGGNQINIVNNLFEEG